MMLSLTLNSPNPLSLSPPSLSPHHLPLRPHPPKPHRPSKLIVATISRSNPSSQPQPQQQLYQPFRPPPSPIPDRFRSLDTNGRLEILTNRLGLWFEYAPLIPSLVQEGFSAPTLEELTGISGVEQNRLVVAAQVRETLVSSKIDPDVHRFFDLGGAELLYEIRLLSASQRATAARFVVEKKLDAKGAQELARAIKDFPRRRGDKGWESFDYVLPGDCLGFMYYRHALEHGISNEMWKARLEKTLDVVESERAKKIVLDELEGKGRTEGESGKSGLVDGAKVPVVRMKVGEVAEATSVVVFPVCKAEEGENGVVEAPWECSSKGDFGVITAEKGWKSWVVLPGWEPVAGLSRGGVAVAFRDARALPWTVNRWYKEEAILVVADRGRKEVLADEGFYLVVGGGSGGNDGFKVQRGSGLREKGVKESLGTVVLVVRPPRDENDHPLSEEDWE